MKKLFVSFLFVALAIVCSAQNYQRFRSSARDRSRVVSVPMVVTPALSVSNVWKGYLTGTSGNVSVFLSAGKLAVVAMVADSPATDHGLSDNIDGATGWVKIDGVSLSLYGDSSGVSLWYKKNLPAGITTITASDASSINGGTLIVQEVTGASTTTPFTVGEKWSGAYSATTNPQTVGVNSASPVSIQFAVVANEAHITPATFTINASGTIGTWNLASVSNSQELMESTLYIISVPNQVFSSSGNKTHSWTTENAAGAMIQAAFH